MKIQIYNWANSKQAEKVLDAFGYKHFGMYDHNHPFELAKDFHSAGLNVMMCQPSDDVQTICVDFEKWFSQR